MQTIEITLDEAMIAQIDRVTHGRALTRTAFIQQSLEAALQQSLDAARREQEILEQERRHAEGYAKYPATPDEFSGWEKIRVWEEP